MAVGSRGSSGLVGLLVVVGVLLVGFEFTDMHALMLLLLLLLLLSWWKVFGVCLVGVSFVFLCCVFFVFVFVFVFLAAGSRGGSVACRIALLCWVSFGMVVVVVVRLTPVTVSRWAGHRQQWLWLLLL